MHDAPPRQVLDGSEHAPHVVLDFGGRHLGEVSLERLAFLIVEDERDLALESEALDQFCHVVAAVQVLEDEHLDQDEGGVDGREDALDGVLPNLAALLLVEGVLVVMVLLAVVNQIVSSAGVALSGQGRITGAKHLCVELLGVADRFEDDSVRT